MAKDEAKAKNVDEADQRFLDEHGEGLSDTARKYAKWVHSEDEHEDRPGQTLATRSHDVIRHWADERDAKPATVPGTEHEGRAGVLRFDFPGFESRNLEELAWDQWFETFDARNLVFLFQERKADGSQSNFFRLDNPEREDG
jgi:hypothetical protein